MTTRILLATDGSAATRGAVRVAAAMARDRGARVDVLAVLEPVADAVGVPPTVLRHAGAVDRMRASNMEAAVRSRLEAAPDPAPQWSVETVSGPVQRTIAEVARRREVDLIVLGRGDRRPGRGAAPSLAMEVVGLAALPVLTVASTLEHLPRRTIAAVDFSASSLRAARVALDVVDGGGRLDLVHVIPSLDFPAALLWGWDDSFTRRADEEFVRFQADLDGPGDVEIVAATTHNDPAEELLARIRADDVDLITAGDHGYLYRGHVLMGSVSTRLLMDASCSVLIAPSPDRRPLVDVVGAVDRATDRADRAHDADAVA